jgi:long-chain fatty acid transport protein
LRIPRKEGVIEMKPVSILGLAAIQCLASGSVWAAGYGLREYSTTAMGAAYAGASASAGNASFLPYNPASSAGVDSFDFSVGMISLLPTSDATYSTALTSLGTAAGGSATQDEFVKTAYVPSFGTRVRINDMLSAGLAVSAPWGLATGYDGGWAGRYYAQQTRFVTLAITPTLAYEVSDNFTIAAGPRFQYAKGKLTNFVDIGTIGYVNSVPNSIPGGQDGDAVFTADDWGYGFVIGAMADLSENVTVGVTYQSAIDHTMRGDLDFTLDSDGIGAILNGVAGILADTPATTDLTTPDKISAGARIGVTDQLDILLETDWTNWSHFDELRVVSANPFQPDDVTVKNWEGSWFVAIGAEYSLDGIWTFRGGFAYDQTPVPDSTRNPRIPDADRYWLSLGVDVRASDRMGFSVAYAHMFLPDQDISMSAAVPANMLRGYLEGRTSASANVLGVQFNYQLP